MYKTIQKVSYIQNKKKVHENFSCYLQNLRQKKYFGEKEILQPNRE